MIKQNLFNANEIPVVTYLTRNVAVKLRVVNVAPIKMLDFGKKTLLVGGYLGAPSVVNV